MGLAVAVFTDWSTGIRKQITNARCLCKRPMQLFYGGLLEVLKPDLCALLPSNLLQSRRGVRCIGNFCVCVCIFGCKCKLADSAAQPTGGEETWKGKEYIFRGEGMIIIFFFHLLSGWSESYNWSRFSPGYSTWLCPWLWSQDQRTRPQGAVAELLALSLIRCRVSIGPCPPAS